MQPADKYAGTQGKLAREVISNTSMCVMDHH